MKDNRSKIKLIVYKCKRLFRGLESISYEEAIELYDNGKATIIDVRNNDEYKENHIEGAINIPVFEIEDKITQVVKDKNDIIIVYCKTGKRSKLAKRILEGKGYPNVYILYI